MCLQSHSHIFTGIISVCLFNPKLIQSNGHPSWAWLPWIVLDVSKEFFFWLSPGACSEWKIANWRFYAILWFPKNTFDFLEQNFSHLKVVAFSWKVNLTVGKINLTVWIVLVFVRCPEITFAPYCIHINKMSWIKIHVFSLELECKTTMALRKGSFPHL